MVCQSRLLLWTKIQTFHICDIEHQQLQVSTRAEWLLMLLQKLQRRQRRQSEKEDRTSKFGELLVPKLLRYIGNWDVAFKKRERGVFTATLFDFQ